MRECGFRDRVANAMNAPIKHGLERAQGDTAMDLMLTGDAAQRVLAMAKNDGVLAKLMAQELVIAVDRTVMTRYLLTDRVARDLLARCIAADPETTLAELQRLAAGGVPSKRKTRRQVKKTRAPAKPKTRVHMTTAQVAELKDRVLAALKAGPASRKQLRRAVKFPSISTYNRIMGELRADRVIKVEGERGKAVYVRGKGNR
jgi:hypothetical protein